jgi:hypothetical protein
MMMTAMAWPIRQTHSHSMRVSPLTLTEMELATTQIKTMTATAQMMRRMVVHSMRINQRQVNVGAALPTQTPIATVLRIAMIIALRLRIQHKSTAMRIALAIFVILQVEHRTAMPTAFQIRAMLVAVADRTVLNYWRIGRSEMAPPLDHGVEHGVRVIVRYRGGPTTPQSIGR